MHRLRQKEQFEVLLSQDWISQVTIDSHICEPDQYEKFVQKAHQAGKMCFLYLPKVFRQENEPWYLEHKEIISAAGFDGILASTAGGVAICAEVSAARKGIS